MLLVLFLLAVCRSIIECVDFNSIPGGDVRGFTRSDAVRPDAGSWPSSCGGDRELAACRGESEPCSSTPVPRRCGGDLAFGFGPSSFPVVSVTALLTELTPPPAKGFIVGSGKD